LAILSGVSWGAGAIVAKRMYTRYPQVDLLAQTKKPPCRAVFSFATTNLRGNPLSGQDNYPSVHLSNTI
ncbi:hypothetical protein ACI3R0_28735, partial [Klebsiella pneumoniae]